MSSAGLPPEEVEYQEAHLYEDYTRNLAGLYLVLVVLAFISMVLRVASRRITGMRLAADDWTFLVGATLGEASFFVSLIYVFDAGLGEHWVALTTDQQALFRKLNYAFNILNLASYPVIKISLLLLYIRIFVSKVFRRVTWGFVCFVAAIGISNTLVAIFACQPVQAFYDISVSGVCINDVQFYWATAVLNVVTDIVILVLPIPLLWRMQTTFRRKLGISLLFVTGGLTFIVSLIRIVYYLQYSAEDPSYTFLGTAFATPSEVCLAIMVASAPTWRPTWMVLARYSRDKFDSLFSRNSRNDPNTLRGEGLTTSQEKGDTQDSQPTIKDRKKRWIKTSNISPFNLSRGKPAVSHDEQQYPTASENSNRALLTRPDLSHIAPTKARQADRSHDMALQGNEDGQKDVVVADAKALGAPNLKPTAMDKHPHEDDPSQWTQAINPQDSPTPQQVVSGEDKQATQGSSHIQKTANESFDLSNGNQTMGYWDGGMARAFGLGGNQSSGDQSSAIMGGIRVDREVAITSEREASRTQSRG